MLRIHGHTSAVINWNNFLFFFTIHPWIGNWIRLFLLCEITDTSGICMCPCMEIFVECVFKGRFDTSVYKETSNPNLKGMQKDNNTGLVRMNSLWWWWCTDETTYKISIKITFSLHSIALFQKLSLVYRHVTMHFVLNEACKTTRWNSFCATQARTSTPLQRNNHHLATRHAISIIFVSVTLIFEKISAKR